MSVHIVDDEQRRDRPHPHASYGFRRRGGHLLCWRSSTMCIDIACVAPPCICPRGARNPTHSTFTTDC